jgi:hypothetical protein
MQKYGFRPNVHVVRVYDNGTESHIDTWFTIVAAMETAEQFCEGNDIVVETYHYRLNSDPERYASMAQGMPWGVQCGDRYMTYCNGRLIGSYLTKDDARHFVRLNIGHAGIVFGDLWDIEQTFCDVSWRPGAAELCI